MNIAMRTTLCAATVFVAGLHLAYAAPAHAAPVSKDEVRFYADAYADHYGVPREMVRAIITQESDWNPAARSEKGAMGLMQLMPETATRYQAIHPFDVEENLSAGIQFLRDLMIAFHGDLRLVAAGYYCGPRYLLKRGLGYTNQDVFAYVSSVRRHYTEEVELARKQVEIAEKNAMPETADEATDTGENQPW